MFQLKINKVTIIKALKLNSNLITIFIGIWKITFTIIVILCVHWWRYWLSLLHRFSLKVFNFSTPFAALNIIDAEFFQKSWLILQKKNLPFAIDSFFSVMLALLWGAFKTFPFRLLFYSPDFFCSISFFNRLCVWGW